MDRGRLPRCDEQNGPVHGRSGVGWNGLNSRLEAFGIWTATNPAWFERVETEVTPDPQPAHAAFGATQTIAAIQGIAHCNRCLGGELLRDIEFRPWPFFITRNQQKHNRQLKSMQYSVWSAALPVEHLSGCTSTAM
jgi:hypothetical protein